MIRFFQKQIFQFAVVGSIGFVVDAVLLTVLMSHFLWSAYSARLISFAFAVSATWYLNRNWTFRHAKTRQVSREYSGYFAVQSLGALINYGVFSLCIFLSPIMLGYPVLPLAIGSGVALFFNYFGAKHIAFRGSSG